MAHDLPAGVKPHAFEATAAAARWLVACAHGRARSWSVNFVRYATRWALRGCAHADAEEDVSALRAHARVTAWLAGRLAPYASSSATDDGLLRARRRTLPPRP